MLKNIIIDPETQNITVDAAQLIQEAEARTHRPGRKTYVDLLVAGKTRLRKHSGWYPEEKKIEVAALFASGVTNATDLERLTGIKSATIRDWRTSEWWPEMMERIHAMHDEDTVSQFTKIVDKSLEVIQDRLINGEMILVKNTNKATGEVTRQVQRRPVALRDATHVAVAIVDKRQLLRGKPTSRPEKASTDDRLSKLAAEFKRFAAAKDVTKEAKQLTQEQ